MNTEPLCTMFWNWNTGSGKINPNFCCEWRSHFAVKLTSACVLSLCQILSVASFHPRHTDVTTNPRGASRSSVAPSAEPFQSAHFCSIRMPKDPRLSWISLRRLSRGRPASATRLPSPTGPSPCTNKSASRYFLKNSKMFNTNVYRHVLLSKGVDWFNFKSHWYKNH